MAEKIEVLEAPYRLDEEWVLKMIRDVPVGTTVYGFETEEKAFREWPRFEPNGYEHAKVPPYVEPLSTWTCIVRRDDLPRGRQS